MQLFNYDTASELMDKDGIDLILASTRHNVGYLSDYWHEVSDEYYVLWDPSATHYCLAGLPKDQAQAAFLVPGASEMTPLEMRDPWIKERRYWGPGYYIQAWTESNPEPGNPMDAAAEVLLEKGLGEGCIAVEMRYLGVNYFERLRSHLPKAKFVDAEPVLWELRKIKSAEEIRRIREACLISSRVWRNMMDQVYAGMTEKELVQLFVQGYSKAGTGQARSYVIFGPAGVTLTNGAPLAWDNPLKEGQFIRVDTQGSYEGYLANLSRVVAFGKVTPDMEQAHALVREMVEKLTELIKPGIAYAEVRSVELEMYEGTGYQPVIPYTGHNVGRVVHEPPYLMQGVDTVIEPGMVLTVEPTVMYSGDGDIFISLEDTLLITDDGCECLTESATLDLYL